MSNNHRLIVETPDSLNVEYVIEEKNTNDKTEPSTWIVGEYMMAGEPNRNKRVYNVQEMSKEVARYNKDYIAKGRALGELNHPESAEVNLKDACHLVTELNMDRSRAMGKSKILSTPAGKIVETLIKDGVQVGVSSRALGKLIPMEGNDNGINQVEDMKLIAIDCVADPSNPGSFVNGILESKQFILNSDGGYEALYDQFEKTLSNLPKKDIDTFLREQVIEFINKING
tara:strand:- start:5467 stop:6153 length:687 start_codon:yes stop_codon:yes gene_type:complete